ncbi:MAG: hypothetical protein Q4P24_18095 [Rhodobacterales bacterium]|nr:hypothetical protein [Rhodobacterales bacterium]
MAGSCLTEKSICGRLLKIILACVLTLNGNPALRALEYLVSARARFHPDKAGRQCCEEGQQAMAPDVSLVNNMSSGGDAAPVENRFGKIAANSSIRQGWLPIDYADQPTLQR